MTPNDVSADLKTYLLAKITELVELTVAKKDYEYTRQIVKDAVREEFERLVFVVAKQREAKTD
jgi:hypothetical protein